MITKHPYTLITERLVIDVIGVYLDNRMVFCSVIKVLGYQNWILAISITERLVIKVLLHILFESWAQTSTI